MRVKGSTQTPVEYKSEYRLGSIASFFFILTIAGIAVWFLTQL